MSDPAIDRSASEADIFTPEDEQAKARAIAEAEIAAGKSIPFAEIRRWLESWGADDELPPPACR